jgi:hypothetical protein
MKSEQESCNPDGVDCTTVGTGKVEGETTWVCPVKIKIGYSERLPHSHPPSDPSQQGSENGSGLAWTIEQRFGGVWKTTAEGISWDGKMPYGYTSESTDKPGEQHRRIFWAIRTDGPCPFSTDRERRFVSHSSQKVQTWFANWESKTGFHFLRCRALKASEWTYSSGGGLICLIKKELPKGDEQNDYGVSSVINVDEGKLFGAVAVTRSLTGPNQEALEIWRLPVPDLMQSLPTNFATAATPAGLYTLDSSGLEPAAAMAVGGWIRLFNATLDPTEIAVGIYRMHRVDKLK